jgi:23S rRNA (cytidine1920-2'-O)/16S rRNA (cytidine1409-2'-O)-methyltransferase
MAQKKQRLDLAILQKGLSVSREKARAMIMAGEVRVNGQVVDKPGSVVDMVAEIVVKSKPRFVSRGGEKLAWALETFGIAASDRICADVGASTGGFTDCLLQNGAGKVYAIDVGYGQIDYRLRRNPRVVTIERTNARYLQSLPEPISLVVVDVSFISLKLLLPTIKSWLLPEADVIPLIKPQFEAGRDHVGKGGVVKDREIHIRVLCEVLSFAERIGFAIHGLTTSPIKGADGNVEFLAWLGVGTSSSADIGSLINCNLADHHVE